MSSQFTTPVVTEMQVIPVAGHDSMLMNLSGAHAPFFTRNIVIIKDNSGHTGFPPQRHFPPRESADRQSFLRSMSHKPALHQSS